METLGRDITKNPKQWLTPPQTRPGSPATTVMDKDFQELLRPGPRRSQLGISPGTPLPTTTVAPANLQMEPLDMDRVIGNVKIWHPDNTHINKAAESLEDISESEDVLPQKWLGMSSGIDSFAGADLHIYVDEYGADVFQAFHTMSDKSNLPRAHQRLIHSIVSRSFKHQHGDLSKLLTSGTAAAGSKRKSKDPDVIAEAKQRDMEKR